MNLLESVELVHVYDNKGKLQGTGELVKTKGTKSLIRWDGSNEEWVESKLVKLVENNIKELLENNTYTMNFKKGEFEVASEAKSQNSVDVKSIIESFSPKQSIQKLIQENLRIKSLVKSIEKETDYDVLNYDEFSIDIMDRFGDDGEVETIQIDKFKSEKDLIKYIKRL